MGAVDEAFYGAVLKACDIPVDEGTLFACHAWQAMEGGTARYNPWNTTYPMPGDSRYNSVGVRNYASKSDGISATAHTLRLHYYDHLRTVFKQSNPVDIGRAIDSSVWGTHGVEAYVKQHWNGGGTQPQYPGTPIREGDRGPAVRKIQLRLHIDVDGIFGEHTKNAVKHFQLLHHLVSDGIVGPRTWYALFGR